MPFSKKILNKLLIFVNPTKTNIYKVNQTTKIVKNKRFKVSFKLGPRMSEAQGGSGKIRR